MYTFARRFAKRALAMGLNPCIALPMACLWAMARVAPSRCYARIAHGDRRLRNTSHSRYAHQTQRALLGRENGPCAHCEPRSAHKPALCGRLVCTLRLLCCMHTRMHTRRGLVPPMGRVLVSIALAVGRRNVMCFGLYSGRTGIIHREVCLHWFGACRGG